MIDKEHKQIHNEVNLVRQFSPRCPPLPAGIRLSAAMTGVQESP